MKQDSAEKTEREFFNLVVFATSVSFGGMFAFFCSFKNWRDDPTLAFSYRTVIGFAIGAAFGWLFWRVIRRLAGKKNPAQP